MSIQSVADLSVAMRDAILAANPAGRLHRADRQDTLMALCRRGLATDCGSRWFRLTDAGWDTRRALTVKHHPDPTMNQEKALVQLGYAIRTCTDVAAIRTVLDHVQASLRAAGCLPLEYRPDRPPSVWD